MFNHNFVLQQARGAISGGSLTTIWSSPNTSNAAWASWTATRRGPVPLAGRADRPGRHVLGRSSGSRGIDSPRPHERFREFIGLGHRFHQSPVCFGLLRTELLKSLGGFAAYLGSDRVLLAELSLHGHVVELPEDLFAYRQHDGQLSRTPSTERGVHYDPSNAGLRFPTFRLGRVPACRASRSAVPRRALCCYAEMVRWPFHYWKALGVDVYHAGRQVIPEGAGPVKRSWVAGRVLLVFLGLMVDAPGQGGGVKARPRAAREGAGGPDADAGRCRLVDAEEDAG
jgi:hypothetical protein